MMNDLVPISIASVAICLLFFGRKRGYEGRSLPKDQLAVVRSERKKKGLYHQEMFLSQVDDIVVGTYFKGWPKKVFIKPGDHEITVRYFNSNPRINHPSPGGHFGALGAVIGGTIKEKSDTHNYYALRWNAQEGHEYIVRFRLKSGTGKDVIVWVEDSETEDVVFGVKPAD